MGDSVATEPAQAVEHVKAPAPAKTAGEQKYVDPIDKYSALIVRGTIVGVGMAGIALFLRNSRIFARFEHVNQIPKDFIRKELELKGRVREVLPSGELRVEHEPIIKLPSLFRRKLTDKSGLLNIRLAGIDMSKAGQQYISKDLRLTNKPVTFTVIKSNDESPDAVDCDVTVKKNFATRTNLNLELIRKGYGRVPAPDHTRHLKSLQSVPAYSRLVNKLLMSEKVADRRGVGVWERDTWVESVQSYPSQVGQMIRATPAAKALVLLFNVTRDVILYGVKLTQQTYALVIGICSYIAGGYRKFAVGVDRLTDKYNKIRQRIKP
ncbi:unnamed protein product [Auanema sp. JU1783]|nr:unnamed protein product [Auanema sp. JU1783]